MHCPSCGHQNPPDAHFCDNCGARLPQGGQAAEVGPSPSQFETQNPGPGGLGWQSSTTMNQPPPASMPQQSMPVQPTPPIQPGRQGGIVGVARNVQQSSQQAAYRGPETILTFLLEQYDTSGNRIRVVPVEMRGSSIRGFILDGNQVEVLGNEKDGLLRAKEIYNQSTASMVKRKLWGF